MQTKSSLRSSNLVQHYFDSAARLPRALTTTSLPSQAQAVGLLRKASDTSLPRGRNQTKLLRLKTSSSSFSKRERQRGSPQTHLTSAPSKSPRASPASSPLPAHSLPPRRCHLSRGPGPGRPSVPPAPERRQAGRTRLKPAFPSPGTSRAANPGPLRARSTLRARPAPLPSAPRQAQARPDSCRFKPRAAPC